MIAEKASDMIRAAAGCAGRPRKGLQYAVRGPF
jgi:hypothetical protein